MAEAFRPEGSFLLFYKCSVSIDDQPLAPTTEATMPMPEPDIPKSYYASLFNTHEYRLNNILKAFSEAIRHGHQPSDTEEDDQDNDLNDMPEPIQSLERVLTSPKAIRVKQLKKDRTDSAIPKYPASALYGRRLEGNPSSVASLMPTVSTKFDRKSLHCSKSSIRFQNYVAGGIYKEIFTITNTGVVLLRLNTTFRQGTLTDLQTFRVKCNSASQSIPPGMSLLYTIVFKPTVKQNFATFLDITTDVGISKSISVTAEINGPIVDFPDLIDFGSCIFGTTQERIIPFRNSGTAGHLEINIQLETLLDDQLPNARKSQIDLSSSYFFVDPHEIMLEEQEKSQVKFTFQSPSKKADVRDRLYFATVRLISNAFKGRTIRLRATESMPQLNLINEHVPDHMFRVEDELVLDLGTCHLKEQLETSIQIRNPTKVKIPFKFVSLDDSEEVFQVSPKIGEVDARSTMTFTVKYHPTTVGPSKEVTLQCLLNVQTACRYDPLLSFKCKGHCLPYELVINPSAVFIQPDSKIGELFHSHLTIHNPTNVTLPYRLYWSDFQNELTHPLLHSAKNGWIKKEQEEKKHFTFIGQRFGKAQETLTLKYGFAELQKSLTVPVMGNVSLPLQKVHFYPKFMDFGPMTGDGVHEKEFKIRNQLDSDILWSFTYIPFPNEDGQSVVPTTLYQEGVLQAKNMCSMNFGLLPAFFGVFRGIMCLKIAPSKTLYSNEERIYHIPYYGDVRPADIQVSASCDPVDCYVGIDKKIQLKLLNRMKMDAEANLTWQVLEPKNFSDVMVHFHRSTVKLHPNVEIKVDATLIAHSDEISTIKLLILCDIGKVSILQEKKHLELTIHVQPLKVDMSVAHHDILYQWSLNEHCVMKERPLVSKSLGHLLDFGEMPVGTVIQRKLILRNVLPVNLSVKVLDGDFMCSEVMNNIEDEFTSGFKSVPGQKFIEREFSRKESISIYEKLGARGQAFTYGLSVKEVQIQPFEVISIIVTAVVLNKGEYEDELLIEFGRLGRKKFVVKAKAVQETFMAQDTQNHILYPSTDLMNAPHNVKPNSEIQFSISNLGFSSTRLKWKFLPLQAELKSVIDIQSWIATVEESTTQVSVDYLPYTLSSAFMDLEPLSSKTLTIHTDAILQQAILYGIIVDSNHPELIQGNPSVVLLLTP